MNIKGPVMAFAIHIQKPPFSKLKAKTRSALNVSDFQSVQRDFSFIVDKNIEATVLVNAAKGADKSLIKDAYIFDQFINLNDNEPKMQGKKSLAITVHIQSSEKTLIDSEIENVSKKIIANIEKAKAIGWVPEKTIQDAIFDTIDYLKKEIESGNVNPSDFMKDLDTSKVKI